MMVVDVNIFGILSFYFLLLLLLFLTLIQPQFIRLTTSICISTDALPLSPDPGSLSQRVSLVWP